jgi:hypothetical protein
MAAVAQRLIRRGVPMEEFPQTTSNVTDSSTNLYELIKGRGLSAYTDEAMRLSINQAIAVETPRGWRIAKEKAKHKIDVVVALGMACHAAVKQKPMAGFGIFEHYRRMSEAVAQAAASPEPVPTVADAHQHLGFMQGFGPRPVEAAVRVVAPIGNESCAVEGASGVRYLAHIEEDGQRCFYMSRADAATLLGPTAIGWVTANQVLAIELADEIRKAPPAPRGMRVVDILRAAEDARPRSMFDKGGHALDTLRMIGRAR